MTKGASYSEYYHGKEGVDYGMKRRNHAPEFRFMTTTCSEGSSGELSGSSGDTPSSIIPQSGRYVFQHNEMEREFHLHIPSDYYPSSSSSSTTTNRRLGSKVVLFFHGWGMNGVDWITASTTKHMADRLGFVLVAPTGLSDAAYGGGDSTTVTKTSWNVGGSSTGVDRNGKDICDGYEQDQEESYCYINSCPCDETSRCAWTHCGDDVAFVLDLLVHLQQNYHICLDQIYAMGYSNGGMFAWELAMDERSASWITAIAPISGLPHCGYGITEEDGSNNSAIPVLLFSGQKDKIIPPGSINLFNINDCTVSADGHYYYYVSASAMMRQWATNLGCDDCSTTEENMVPSRVSVPGVDWTTHCTTYCTDHSTIPRPLQLDCRTPRGHGHESWMTKVVLEFFNSHAKNRPCTLFGTKRQCSMEHPRCQWNQDQCIYWTGDSHSTMAMVSSVVSIVIMSILLVLIGYRVMKLWINRRRTMLQDSVNSTELL